MQGKYLITTDNWFYAPDGKQYRAGGGEATVLGDDVLGVKTNRNSSNWFVQVGSDDSHVIIAGCQIHYAVKCKERPSNQSTVEKEYLDETDDYFMKETPCRIYFFD